MRRVAASLPTVLLATVLLAAVTACGGGGGGGGGPTQPPPPAAGITFTAGGNPGANSITLVQGAGTTATTLVLELRANEVQNLFGVAFDLVYPSSILRFSGATEGDFLAGGTGTSFQGVESPTGNLIIGLSQLGSSQGVSGSGLLLSLQFTAAASGDGNFTFADNQAYFPNGTPQGGVAWQAGSVRVTR